MKIGIDIGGSHIGVGLLNDNGEILLKKEETLLDKKEIEKKIINIITNSINQILEERKLKIKDIKQIGIASPGTIKEGYIINSNNLGIKKFNIKGELEKIFSVKILVKNDAKCAAIAENKYGCLKNYKNTIFMTLGTGIGGAVFINNKLQESTRNPGYEIGHIIIQKNGRQCSCGAKGCFETYASIKALRVEITKMLGIKNDISGQEIRKLIRQNKENEKMQEILDKYIENLVTGIASLVNIFEPDAIGIGGSFAYYDKIFLSKLKQEFKKSDILFNNAKDIEIKIAEFKNDAGIIGAASL